MTSTQATTSPRLVNGMVFAKYSAKAAESQNGGVQKRTVVQGVLELREASTSSLRRGTPSVTFLVGASRGVEGVQRELGAGFPHRLSGNASHAVSPIRVGIADSRHWVLERNLVIGGGGEVARRH